MDNSPDDNESNPTHKSAADDQFRAVVKRLLDTPPMHKTKDAQKPAKRAAKKRD